MRHLLVTGGSGFLGAHVVKRAVEAGDRVTVFDTVEPPYLAADWPVEFVEGDIRDTHRLVVRVGEADAIVHLAGILGTAETIADPLPSIEVNTVASVRLFELLRSTNRPAVVTVNGNHQWFNTYAISKEAAGRFAIMYNREFGTQIAVCRVYNAYGEWQKDRPVRKVVPEFARRIIEGVPIEIFGSGEQEFDLVYAGDVADALYRAVSVDHGAYNRILEIGSGQTITANRLAEQMQRIAGSGTAIVHVPMRPGEPEVSYLKADLETSRALGYRPTMAMETGLRQTLAWYAKYFARVGGRAGSSSAGSIP